MKQTKAVNRDLIEKSYQTTYKIVLIQIFSAIILIAIGWFIAAEVDNSVSPNAVIGLWTALISLVVLSFILGRILFSWNKLKSNFEKNGAEGTVKTLQLNTIFLFSLGQIIAIVGFLIATLTVNKFEMLRAGAIALVVFLYNFPRKNIWEKVVASLEKV